MYHKEHKDFHKEHKDIFLLLNSELNHEECDATEADNNSSAGLKKILTGDHTKRNKKSCHEAPENL